MRNKKTAVERPAVKYLKYELAQRPIIDKLQLHYHEQSKVLCYLLLYTPRLIL